MDTSPPIFYLNDFSKDTINLIEEYNKLALEIDKNAYKIGYTFDAGPHAVLLIHKQCFIEFLTILN